MLIDSLLRVLCVSVCVWLYPLFHLLLPPFQLFLCSGPPRSRLSFSCVSQTTRQRTSGMYRTYFSNNGHPIDVIKHTVLGSRSFRRSSSSSSLDFTLDRDKCFPSGPALPRVTTSVSQVSGRDSSNNNASTLPARGTSNNVVWFIRP